MRKTDAWIMIFIVVLVVGVLFGSLWEGLDGIATAIGLPLGNLFAVTFAAAITARVAELGSVLSEAGSLLNTYWIDYFAWLGIDARTAQRWFAAAVATDVMVLAAAFCIFAWRVYRRHWHKLSSLLTLRWRRT